MTNQTRPTRKQKQILNFIQNFISGHGYSPSYREIASGCGYSSVATVAVHINNLIKRGWLEKRDHESRSLEVVGGLDPQPITLKHVTASQEKWLVDHINMRFDMAEKDSDLTQETIDEIYVLVGALSVLGFTSAANALKPRLSALKKNRS